MHYFIELFCRNKPQFVNLILLQSDMLRGVPHSLVPHSTLCWLTIHHALTALIECHHAVIFLTYSSLLFTMHLLLNPQSTQLSLPSLSIFTLSVLRCHIPLQLCLWFCLWDVRDFYLFFLYFLLNPHVMWPFNRVNFLMWLSDDAYQSSQVLVVCAVHVTTSKWVMWQIWFSVTSVQQVQDQATHLNTHRHMDDRRQVECAQTQLHTTSRPKRPLPFTVCAVLYTPANVILNASDCT